jgi:mitochondrial import receptor subunit TOM40
MLQLEGEYVASDCTLNAKVINPGVTDNTGIALCSILQSVTPNLALGAEAIFQRPTTEIEESSISYVAKYATPKSVLTANFQQPGLVQASYFHKVNDMAEFGVELQALVAQGKRDAACTLGAKFDFVKSTFRTQIDTTGRVSAVLEERLAPSLTLTLSGDLDHLKGQSKFGIGLQINS